MTYRPERVDMHESRTTYVSARTISADLDVPERTVRRWMSEGELPTVRFGVRCVLIPRTAYEDFVRQHSAA
jgi:excisionase family DNA binding protein